VGNKITESKLAFILICKTITLEVETKLTHLDMRSSDIYEVFHFHT
jgi:hypothetical protein